MGAHAPSCNKKPQLVEDRLRKRSPERKATYYKDKEKEKFKYQPSQSQTSESSGDKKHRA
jgi:hypothetical protein